MREATKNEQIYRDIRSRIISGGLHPGEQLATQQSLAQSYGVTVMTLRHALERLERDGLIEATQGRGTFVSTRPFQYRVNNLWSFAQQMHEQGRALTTRLVSFSIPPLEVPDAEVRSRLALGPKSDVYLPRPGCASSMVVRSYFSGATCRLRLDGFCLLISSRARRSTTCWRRPTMRSCVPSRRYGPWFPMT